MRRFSPLPWAGLIVLALLAGAIYWARHDLIIFDPAGPVGLSQRRVMLETLLLCAVVVVPVFALLFFFAWRYRADGPAASREHHPGWDHDSAFIEALWWVVPSAIIVALSVLAWQSSRALDPYRPLAGGDPLLVQVVALDWKWLFIYPAQGVASVNVLELPIDRPVRFELTADAPMNSFWIPQLGGQIMVMPGMTTQLNLEASRPGDFSGFSGNISGAGFSGMAFTARAVAGADFDAWAAAARASSTPLDRAAYATLAQPSSYARPATYAPVADRLYDSIVAGYMTMASTTSDAVMMLP